MTRLIKAANPEELQEKLDQLLDDDSEDRPWYLHGDPFRHDGYYFQFMTDQSPHITSIEFSTDKVVKLIRTLQKEFPDS